MAGGLVTGGVVTADNRISAGDVRVGAGLLLPIQGIVQLASPPSHERHNLS